MLASAARQSMLSSRARPSKGVALITGGARGIGRGIALRLADDGYDVAVNDLPDTPELEEVVNTIAAKGRRTLATPGNVSEESVVIDMIESTVKMLGSLDIVRTAQSLFLLRTPSLLPYYSSVGLRSGWISPREMVC